MARHESLCEHQAQLPGTRMYQLCIDTCKINRCTVESVIHKATNQLMSWNEFCMPWHVAREAPPKQEGLAFRRTGPLRDPTQLYPFRLKPTAGACGLPIMLPRPPIWPQKCFPHARSSDAKAWDWKRRTTSMTHPISVPVSNFVESTFIKQTLLLIDGVLELALRLNGDVQAFSLPRDHIATQCSTGPAKPLPHASNVVPFWVCGLLVRDYNTLAVQFSVVGSWVVSNTGNIFRDIGPATQCTGNWTPRVSWT